MSLLQPPVTPTGCTHPAKPRAAPCAGFGALRPFGSDPGPWKLSDSQSYAGGGQGYNTAPGSLIPKQMCREQPCKAAQGTDGHCFPFETHPATLFPSSLQPGAFAGQCGAVCSSEAFPAQRGQLLEHGFTAAVGRGAGWEVSTTPPPQHLAAWSRPGAMENLCKLSTELGM